MKGIEKVEMKPKVKIEDWEDQYRLKATKHLMEQ